MKKNLKEMAEKSLKSFLKKKKIGYTAALLTAFLISGGIGLASSAELYSQAAQSQESLLANIEAQKAEIMALIEENERALREARLNQDELIRKGDFYSKPIYPSHQIFLTYINETAGKGKDNTKSEWANTLEQIRHKAGGGLVPKGKNPYAAGELLAGYTASLNTVPDEDLDPKINGNMDVFVSNASMSDALNSLNAGNGVYIDEPAWIANVELGANIVPLNPDLPTINKTVSVSVGTPSLTGIPNPSVPAITPPGAPATVTVPSISVSAPSAVGTISINPPTMPNPQVPGPKSITVPTVTTPSAVEPTMIVPPEAPDAPQVIVPVIPTFNATVVSSGNGTTANVINVGYSNGYIEMVALQTGDFKIERNGDNRWWFEFSNYAGVNMSTLGAAINGVTGVSNGTITTGSSWGPLNAARQSGVEQLGFQKLVGSTANATMLSNANFLYTNTKTSTNLNEFVHMDLHGAAANAGQRTQLLAGTAGLSNQQHIMDSFDDAVTNVHHNSTSSTSTTYTWINSGKIVLEGANASITNHYDHNNGSTVKAIAMNTGEISIVPYQDSTITRNEGNAMFVMSLDGTGAHHIMYNSGVANIYTKESAGFLSGSSSAGRPLSIVNRNEINIYGEKSVGIYIKTASNNIYDFATDDFNYSASTGSFKPMTLYGDSNIGLYIPVTTATPNQNRGVFAVDIGSVGMGNQTFNTLQHNGSDYTAGNSLVNYDLNASGANNNIEGSVGIVSNQAIALTAHQIRIYDKAEGSIGVVPQSSVALSLGDGSIELIGGSKNIGIYADVIASSIGDVSTTGAVELNGGTGNIGIFASGVKQTSNPFKVEVNEVIASGTSKNNILIYGDTGATINIVNGVTATGMTVDNPVNETDGGLNNENTNNSMVAFAKDTGTIINMNKASVSASPDIEITGAQVRDEAGNLLTNVYRGTALMADAGGIINAQNYNIKVTNGAAGVVSMGSTGSNIDVSGSTIEVNNGYAAYSDGLGGINLTNANIILDGSSTAFDWDMSGPNPLTLFNTNIVVNSDNVIVFNLKNASAISVSSIGGITPAGVTVTPGSASNYKEAAVDNIAITVDVNIDKSSTSGNDFYYYNRFIAQNSQLTVNNGVTVLAELNSTQASAFKNQVIALEMNASTNSTSISNTSITNNGTIRAARTDGGNGAVGAFINYGTLTNNGTISIQDGYTTALGGTGIYATNGSLATNAAGGNINIYGEEGLGIYATAWRELPGGAGYAGAEFGTGATGQGLTKVENHGNITTSAKSSVGIYMDNNSDLEGTLRAITGENSTGGTITVGEDSIAMYARGNGVLADTTIGNFGTLVVGKNSAGMYGENTLTISNIGSLDLDEGATGIVLDPNSTVSIGGSVGTITASSVGDKAVIAINGATSGTPVGTTIALPTATMNLSGTTGVTALYAQGVSGASNQSSNLDLGTNGVGVYVNNGDASNLGTINMGAGRTSAVGMYTANGIITNALGGTINVGDASQIGMAASGSSASAINNGAINLGVTGATGLYVDNGATITDNAAGNIGFGAAQTFGIVSDGGIVQLTGGTTLTLANNMESIYVYARNNSSVNINGSLIINGVSDAGNQKSVGIYLDGTNTLTNNNTITADNAAIGIYSSGANTLNGGTYAATGDKSVGVYFTNGGTLSGVIVEAGNGTADSAMGIYVANGTTTVSGGGLSIDLQNGIGTGIYLSNGASISGDTITITNANASNSNIGLYYDGTSGTATHGTDLVLAGANRLVGIYANGGLGVTNNQNITDTTIIDSVAVLVGGGSTYTGGGTLTGAAGGDTIGYYVNNGSAINSGTVNLAGTGANSVAMVAEAATGQTALVRNTGTINADSSVGLVMNGSAGTSQGENTGTINVAATGTGAFLQGTGAQFNGAGGTISVSGIQSVGIGLDGTGTGQVSDAGTLNLGADSVGVFASNNSVVDFPITLAGANGTGVFVEGGSSVTGNIDGSQGIDVVSVYLENATATLTNAQISTGQGGVSTSLGLFLGGSGQTYNLTSGTITADHNGTVAVYVGGGNSLNYGAGTTINVGDGAIGIYATGTGSIVDTQGGTMNIDGAGVGIYVTAGSTANVGTTGPIDVNFTGTGGVLTFNDGGTINLGTQINILSGTGTLAATTNGNLSNSGTINIGNGSVGLLGIYNTTGTYNITNTSTGLINVFNGGVGLAATGSAASVIVENYGHINVDGDSSVGMYSNLGPVDNVGTITVTDGGIGIYIDTNGSITNLGTIDVTGGVGYVVDGITLMSAPTGNLTLHAGSASNYSIAGYYVNTNGTIVLPTVTQSDYSIVSAINGGTNNVVSVSTGSATGTNQIGVYASNSVTSIGAVAVDGDENIGVYGENGTVAIGAMTVGLTTPSSYSSDMSNSSVGAYMKNGTLSVTSLDVSANGIGAYGENSNVTVDALKVGATGVGAYATGTGTETLTVTTSLDVGTGSLGAYGKNTDVSVTGVMTIGAGTAVGIISEGTGNINYSGTATIANKGTDTASIGIYAKDGSGTITTTSGSSFSVGDGGYAIYADNLTNISPSGPTATVNNAADMILGEASVGIYAGGKVVANNSGNIVVGTTDLGGDTTPDHSELDKHLNSLAMYGEKGAQLTNSGVITVNNEHSLGVYLKEAGTKFVNNGTINVDGGGTGILATNFSTVENNGTITLGNTDGSVGTLNVGIGVYGGSTATNTGVINVGAGVGVYIGDTTIFNNTGTINIDNGVGTSGDGVLHNSGTIAIVDLDGSGGTTGALKGVSAEGSLNNQGAITITNTGDIIINNQYVHSGSFVADGHVVVNNATINITAGTGTIAVGSIEGNFVLDSSFLTTGNGYAWSVENFLQTVQGSGITGSELTISGSPLYYATITATSLEIAKQPYAYIVTGSQFDNLYNGMDSLLAQDQDGIGNDSKMLTQMNAYLDNIYNQQGEAAFSRETSRVLAEMRGDVYTTIQQRLNNIQSAFDSAHEDLINSYNFTRDTGKYSVIYQQGSYRDKTLGVDDYDYRVQGLLYMNEFEGRNYGNKWGYSLGFAVSRFDFDDAPTYGDDSKEDVYSIRAGIHKVTSLDEDDTWNLRTKLEVGYNKHETERTLELDNVYTNKGKFDSYNVSLDNRLSKTLYRSNSKELKLYGDLNMEYGQVNGFTEKAKGNSGLELKIDNRDYYSIEAALGVQGSTRAYLGKKMSVKLVGDLSYGYDFGNTYDKKVKAKVAGGTEDWYNLIRPEEEKGRIKGKVGLTVENANNFGVTFDVEARKHDNKKDADLRYGVKFNYKFMN